MAVKIRMRRTGANRDISFRVVAIDERNPRDGRYLENLGWYDPKRKGTNFKLDIERVEHWLKHGAILSDTVRSLVRKHKAAAVAPKA